MSDRWKLRNYYVCLSVQLLKTALDELLANFYSNVWRKNFVCGIDDGRNFEMPRRLYRVYAKS